MKLYRQADRIAARVIDGVAFIVSVDRQELVELNEVGTFIWSRIVEPTSVDGIAVAVAADFEVGLERARQDVERFVDVLVACQAVAVQERPSE